MYIYAALLFPEERSCRNFIGDYVFNRHPDLFTKWQSRIFEPPFGELSGNLCALCVPTLKYLMMMMMMMTMML